MKLVEACIIGGKEIKPNQLLKIEDPAEEAIVARVPIAGDEEIEQAVRSASEAFLVWKKTKVKDRANAIKNLATLMDSHREELAQILTMESGKPIKSARGEIESAIQFLLYCSEETKRLSGKLWIDSDLREGYFVLREPIGPCAVITPFNYPISTLVTKIGPAFGVGCTVIVKPDEHTPLSTLYIGKLSKEAGFPPGVINIITGPGNPTGEKLVKNPGVKVISFTGSTEVGKLIYANSAPFLRKVILELGGNCPAIVASDSNWKELLPQMVQQAFKNSGQYCYRITRFIVHEDIYNDFLKNLIEKVSRLTVGNPKDKATDLGPLNNKRIYERFCKQMETIYGEGAKLEYGLLPKMARKTKGYYCSPLIFSNPKEGLVEKEEFFGPVVFVYSYKDDKEALVKANSSPFGLAGYIFTKDMERASYWMTNLEVGSVWVNSIHQARFDVPFGGYKESGLGREKSIVGFEEFTELKTVYWPFLLR